MASSICLRKIGRTPNSGAMRFTLKHKEKKIVTYKEWTLIYTGKSSEAKEVAFNFCQQICTNRCPACCHVTSTCLLRFAWSLIEEGTEMVPLKGCSPWTRPQAEVSQLKRALIYHWCAAISLKLDFDIKAQFMHPESLRSTREYKLWIYPN